MGNTRSTNSSSPGALSILLDPPPATTSPGGAYIAGQPISGSVYAQANTNITSPLNVKIFLSGEEKCVVRYTKTETYHSGGETRRRTVTRYKNANRQIINVCIHLGEVNTEVVSGDRHRFPFQIQLPPDLPSTMHCEETYSGRHGRGYNGKGNCRISYKLRAELLDSRGSLGIGDHAIVILAKPLPYNEPVPNLVPPITKMVNSFLCFNSGTITMGCRLQDTRIGQGESAIIDFACKNQSRKGIDRVEVDVKEEAYWFAGGKSNNASRIIAKQTFRPTARWDKMSKEDAKELMSKSRNQTDSFREQQHTMLRMIHKAIFDGENRAFLSITNNSLQSYGGMLVKVKHRLKVKVFTSGTCTENPTIKFPIYVGTRSSLLEQPLEEPPTVIAEAVVANNSQLASPAATPEPSAPPDEWAGCVTATPVYSSQSAAVVGGNTVWEEENGSPPVVTAVAENLPSLEGLLREIEYSVSPLRTVERRIGQDEWRMNIFNVMTPQQYSSVIMAVTVDFEKPEVGAMVAQAVNNFTHEYILATLRIVSDWVRIPLVTKVLPYCQDLNANAGRIQDVLTDWERICTNQAFEEALRS